MSQWRFTVGQSLLVLVSVVGKTTVNTWIRLIDSGGGVAYFDQSAIRLSGTHSMGAAVNCSYGMMGLFSASKFRQPFF